jgi:hypothetical protein
LIDHLGVDPEFAYEYMRGMIEIMEMNGRVYDNEEITVKPTASLRNQFRDLLGKGQLASHKNFTQLTWSGTSVTV